jgi:gamma-glutamyl:cysteine ligase YbdK (ATP-grasp superfamily)
MPATEWPEAEQRIAEIARTRRGRHRDRALASYRRARALELRAQGMDYAAIAEAVGYSHKASAYTAVAKALQAREAEDVDMLRRVVGDRLELLHEALWPKAKAGDVTAVMAVLRVMEEQCRLLGLYSGRKKDPKDRWPSCHGPATVVVHPDDCRHVGCEKHGSFAALASDG